MKLTGAAILVSRGMKVLQAAPAAYPNRYAATWLNLHLKEIYNVDIGLKRFITEIFPLLEDRDESKRVQAAQAILLLLENGR